jgi:hypothetical protein
MSEQGDRFSDAARGSAAGASGTGNDKEDRKGPRFSAEDEALLASVAGRVVRMGLATPAVFFLESVKPLSFIGSQALIFFEPFVRAFFDISQYEQFARLMEDRQALERLLVLIETRDEEEQERDRAAKAAARAAKKAAKEAAKRGGL